MPEIQFTINTDTGALDLRVMGVAGPACAAVTRLAEELLGTPTHEERTAEYHVRPRVQPPVRRHGGQI